MPNNPGDKARRQLSAIERRRQLAVLSEFQKIQLRLADELLDLFNRIEKERQIDGNASPGTLFRKARAEKLFEDVTDEIRGLSARLALVTTSAQRQAVAVAREQIGDVAELAADLNQFDGPATRELIGLAGNGRPLAVHFATLADPTRTAMFDALFYGLAVGRSNAAIAAEVRDALGGSTVRAMTIVRTETNRAYRESSRKFYDQAPDVIGWRWIAALDLNTCVICWRNHGRVFKTKTKMATHPNCRCTMVPVFADDVAVPTGPELFDKLNDAQRRAILGPRRFDRYMQGAELADFLETTKSAFGLGRRIKPLATTTFKIKPRRPTPPETASGPA